MSSFGVKPLHRLCLLLLLGLAAAGCTDEKIDYGVSAPPGVPLEIIPPRLSATR